MWSRLFLPLYASLQLTRTMVRSSPNGTSKSTVGSMEEPLNLFAISSGNERSNSELMSMSMSTAVFTSPGQATQASARAVLSDSTTVGQNSLQIRALLLALCGIISGMPSSVLKGASTEITAIAIQSFSLSCSSGEYGNQTKYATTGNAVIGTDQSISKQSVAVEDDKSILSQLREQSLETIAVVIDSSIDTISTHISSVAPLLVAVAQKDSKVKLKLLALKILLSFVAGAPKFSIAIPYVRLYPVKKMIIKGLGVVIDDRRRIVRKLAAKVRNEWSVLEK